MLKIYNTLTKTKEDFRPLQAGKIALYVCGMTVYDYCHIGHGRIFVVFDMVNRYLRFRGYDVTYVRNITDIDDKIIQRANENNEDIHALTDRFIEAMHHDEQLLGVGLPDQEPRATEHMADIIQMIQCLLDRAKAYIADSGDVYYDVSQFEQYGELAHQDLAQLQAGVRVEVTESKRSPLDFVLWKQAKADEPSWDSPWGAGRPGWHIECSAMSTAMLGKTFDIHGGGVDLVFPHHQNEIAQSEGAHGCRFVNNWMHVGHVQVDREKMSKSLGNFFTIREVLAKYDAESVRYFMLASHYRSPINYSTANLDSAHAALQRLYMTLRGLPAADTASDEGGYEAAFTRVMDDDFNTPEAFAVLFDMVREINRLKDCNHLEKAAQLGQLLRRLGASIGVAQQDPDAFLRGKLGADEALQIEQLIAQRNAAREAKDWRKADAIRDQLLAQAIELEDTAEGTIWRSHEAKIEEQNG